MEPDNLFDNEDDTNTTGVDFNTPVGQVPPASATPQERVADNKVNMSLPEIQMDAPEEEVPQDNAPRSAIEQGSPVEAVGGPQEPLTNSVDMSLPEIQMDGADDLVEAPKDGPSVDMSLPEIQMDGPDFTSGTDIPDHVVNDLVKPPELPQGKDSLTADDVRANPERMKIVRDYLNITNGVQAKGVSDEEAYDQWMSNMRLMGSNEIVLLSNIRNLANANDEDKVKIGKAYAQFDQMGNMFTSDGFGGALTGIKDYSLGTLTAPSTWLGLGMGNILTRMTSTGMKQALVKQTLDVAAETAAKSLASSTSSALVKSGSKLAAQEAATSAVKAVAAQGAKSYAIKQGLITAGVDGTINGLMDYAYQEHMMDADVQGEYNVIQGLLSVGTGAVTGGISGRASYKNTYNELVMPQLIKEGNERFRNAQAQFTLTPTQIKANIKAVNDNFVNWADKVKKGEALATGKLTDSQGIFDMLMGKDGVLPRLMKEAGYVIDKSSEVSDTQQVLTFAHTLLDEPSRDALDASLKEHFGFTMNQATDIIAKVVNQGALNQQTLSNLGRTLGTVSSQYAAAKKASLLDRFIPDKLSDTAAVRGMHYVQNLWRRALVAHPGTTAVNVMGYGQAKAASELALVVAGSYHGSIGLAAKLAKPFSATAAQLSDESLGKARAIFQSQAYSIGNMLSPGATLAQYEAFLDAIPESFSKQLRRTVGQGIEGSNTFSQAERDALTKAVEAARTSGKKNVTVNGKTYPVKDAVDQINEWKKGVVENSLTKGAEFYIDKVNTIAGVRLQDSVTKSFSMLEAMDRNLRIATGKGFNDTLQSVGVKGIPDEIFQKSINEALEDTFSMDYTKSNSLVKGIASFVEQASNTPGVGFIIPFGRFMNNAASFTFRYSPFGVIRPFLNKEVDMTTAATQAIVGSAWLAAMVAHEKEKAEKGIPWYVEEGEDGTQYDRTNLAPGAWFHITGRIGYHALFGQDGKWLTGDEENIADKDLMTDLLAQAGTIGLPSTVDKSLSGITQGMSNLVSWAAGSGDEDQISSGKGGMEIIGSWLASVAAGFTRPMEPMNVVVGMMNGSDYNVDRNQLEGGDLVISQATRYVDQIFGVLGGSVSEDKSKPLGPVKASPINPKSDQDPNPYGRLFGSRIRAPQTYTEKMLGETTMAEWRATQKTAVPGLDAVVNEKVFNYLEPRAERLLSSNAWKMANTMRRREMAKTLLDNSRNDVEKWIEARPGSLPKLDLERRKLTHRKLQYTQAAAKHFGLENKQVKDMSFLELSMMNQYMDILENYDRNLLK